MRRADSGYRRPSYLNPPPSCGRCFGGNLGTWSLCRTAQWNRWSALHKGGAVGSGNQFKVGIPVFGPLRRRGHRLPHLRILETEEIMEYSANSRRSAYPTPYSTTTKSPLHFSPTASGHPPLPRLLNSTRASLHTSPLLLIHRPKPQRRSQARNRRSKHAWKTVNGRLPSFSCTRCRASVGLDGCAIPASASRTLGRCMRSIAGVSSRSLGETRHHPDGSTSRLWRARRFRHRPVSFKSSSSKWFRRNKANYSFYLSTVLTELTRAVIFVGG